MLDFSAGGCQIDIRINDIPVVNFEIEGQASTVVPINYAIPSSGKQLITGRILPLSGQERIHKNAFVDFQVKCMDAENNFVLKKDFEKYSISHREDSGEDFPVYLMDYFDGDVPYEFIGWKNGISINDIEDVFPKLLQAYNKLAEAIQNKDYRYFIDTFRNRERIMNTAMYLGPTDSMVRLEHYIEKFESGFNDVKISENVLMQVVGGNRAVCLKKRNADHALSVRNLELNREIVLDLMFNMPEGKTEFQLV